MHAKAFLLTFTHIHAMPFLFAGKVIEQQGSQEGVHLIMAGGYDDRVLENREYYEELCDLRDTLNLQEHISFLRSFSDSQKRTLLHNSTCLIYTPDKEHFGIVPIESMYMKCPVIAVRSGGPLETVADGETGYLCRPEAGSFAEAMTKFVTDKKLSTKMGQAGYDRVISKFAFDTFTEQLNTIVQKLCN